MKNYNWRKAYFQHPLIFSLPIGPNETVSPALGDEERSVLEQLLSLRRDGEVVHLDVDGVVKRGLAVRPLLPGLVSRLRDGEVLVNVRVTCSTLLQK